MTSLKTLFIITVSTARLIFPGMPAATGLPDNAKPPSARSFNIEVVSEIAASRQSKVSVAVPEGLKAGSKVDLQIDPREPKPAPKPEVQTIQLAEYWGSGRDISGDQPQITKAGTVITPPARALTENSYAYWPTVVTPPLDPDASTPGSYTLKTDYCGATSVTLSQYQDFLGPVDITSASHEPDLTQPIVVRWRPVPNAAGYLLKAYGGNDQRTITWTSSVKPELSKGIEYHPVSKDDLAKYIKEGVLIPPYVISTTIPAGIFKGSMSVMLTMTAVGRDLVQTKDGIDTQVIVRSTASVPLYNTPQESLKQTPPKAAK